MVLRVVTGTLLYTWALYARCAETPPPPTPSATLQLSNNRPYNSQPPPPPPVGRTGAWWGPTFYPFDHVDSPRESCISTDGAAHRQQMVPLPGARFFLAVCRHLDKMVFRRCSGAGVVPCHAGDHSCICTISNELSAVLQASGVEAR